MVGYRLRPVGSGHFLLEHDYTDGTAIAGEIDHLELPGGTGWYGSTHDGGRVGPFASAEEAEDALIELIWKKN